jgi:hypothetical protein
LLQIQVLSIPQVTFILEQAATDMQIATDIKNILEDDYERLKPSFYMLTVHILLYSISPDKYNRIITELQKLGNPKQIWNEIIKYLVFDNLNLI